jgi:hypothetical protein
MRFKASQGSVSIVIEVILLAIVIFGFLFFVKAGNDRAKTSQTYYPNQTSTSRVTISSADRPAGPAGVRVGEEDEPTITGYPIGESTTRPSSGFTITFTDFGFSPTALTVPQGQTVTFINKSKKSVWPVSPYFNAGAEIPPGGASSVFLPRESRTYEYTNASNPVYKGKIVVE